MGDAYRDDLVAARARVADLEREHAALAADNAKLTALVTPAPAPIDKRKKPMLAIATVLVAACVVGGLVGNRLLVACAAAALVTLGKVALAMWGGIRIGARDDKNRA